LGQLVSVTYPSGVFDLTDHLWVSADDAVIQGAGIGKTILKKPRASTFSLIVAKGRKNLTVKDLTIDGKVAMPSRTCGAGLSFVSCKNVKIQNVEILNVDLQGFFASMVDGIELDNVRTKRTWTGLCFNSCLNGNVHDCAVDTTDGDAIYLTDSAAATTGCQNMTVKNNTLRNVGDTGIDSSMSNDMTKCNCNIHVLGNIIDSPNVKSNSPTPNSVGITVSRTARSEFSCNIVENFRRPDRPAFPAKGIWIGQIPSPPVNPLETYVKHNRLFNNDIPIKTAGQLPNSYVFDNEIDPDPNSPWKACH
jgi:hypothetical protein